MNKRKARISNDMYLYTLRNADRAEVFRRRLLVCAFLGACLAISYSRSGVAQEISTSASTDAAPPVETSNDSSDDNRKKIEYPRVWRLSAEFHFSVLSDAADRSVLGDSIGYGLQGGYRRNRWGLFIHAEQNMWFTSETSERSVVQGAANIGLGVDVLYFNNRMESSLVLGPSILLFDTALDDAPKVGLFAEVRFTTVRFNIHRNVTLRLAPLTFAFVAPVLSGIPLAKVEYRTVLTFEFHSTSRKKR